jgi:GH24 family phage-related lysozyme (muramidase)
MSAINPTDNTALIVDEFISYAVNHLNTIKGTISTISLYTAGPPPSPVQIPGPGILNWTGYFVSPSTPSKIVTQDDFKPKEAVDDHNSVRPTKEENNNITGVTEQQINNKLEEPDDLVISESTDVVIGEVKFNSGKPFVSGFRSGGGGGFQSGGGNKVDLGDLDFSEDWVTLAAKFIGKNEGFTERATWDVNAYRLGFGTENILGSDGKVRSVQPPPSYHKETGQEVPPNPPGDTTNVTAALKMLEYEIKTTYKNRLVGDKAYQIPQTTFDALTNKQKAALISYVYNVGSLRAGIATAIKAGNLSSATTQIQAGPVTPERYREGLQRRRNEEATMFST